MIPRALVRRERAVFSDGQWRAGQGAEPLRFIDPSQGAIFAELTPASSEQVHEAARAAGRAFPAWRALQGSGRAPFLRAMAEGLRARKPDLTALQMRNNGKPRFEAELDIDDAAATFDYYAGLAETIDTRRGAPVALPEPLAGRSHIEPLGPVALIVPWNFPLVTSAWKLAPALAAGCTAVLKPSEFTSLAELAYGDIAVAAGLPPGVLNIVPGGGEVGAALCADPAFRKISFTGSNATGRAVMAAAAQRSVPVSLELGGKSPIIVLDDADVDEAVALAAAGIFFNCGQMCSATSRLIVHEKRAGQVTEALVAKAESLVVDTPDNPDAEMGPLTTTAQRAKVGAYLDLATRDGLDCLTGGALREEEGFFAAPSIYRNVPAGHRLWREEIFGPVLCIATFRNDQEAIALANDSDFGLAATLVGKDAERAAALATDVLAGHIWINGPQVIFPNTAWGGFKASGIGRELGPWALAAYSAVKHITLPAPHRIAQ